MATEAGPDGTVVKKRSGFGKKLLGAVALLAAGIYVGDLAMNDDLDTLSDRFRSRLPEEERKDRPKVVILGTGWGAMSMLRKLHTDKFDVTVVSPRNFFLFTPLLASTTSGLLEVRSIMEPIRKYCIRAGRAETRFVEMAATKVDPVSQKVTCSDTSAVKGLTSQIVLDYDYLVVSVGAETATFNIPGVTENAIYMKSIQDSRKIRDTVMDCFETAMIPGQPSEEIDRLLHFVVAGGGPAGVEFTGELYDFITRDLSQTFPEVADRVRISLVEALPKILPMFDSKLIEYTEQKLNSTRKVQVWTKRAVTKVEPQQITVKNMDTGELQPVPYGALVWVTGNAPVPLTKALISDLGSANQPVPRALTVDEHLLVKGADNIFALGDCALFGRLPPTAQVASQQGRYLGRLFNQCADEMNADAHAKRSASAVSSAGTIAAADSFKKARQNANPFVFNYLGTMAYIGDSEAVADFGEGKGKFSGFSTWLLWRSVYMSKLLSVRNRFLVASDWIRAALFGRDISRG
jgi:NADH:ubiquinone reductase (non-electrogenic)